MIRRPRAAVSSSVQSGRMFGAGLIFEAVTCIPSVAEGVLVSAERGGYRQRPGTVATPLDQKSLRRHPTSGRPARPDPLSDRGALQRLFADRVGNNKHSRSMESQPLLCAPRHRSGFTLNDVTSPDVSASLPELHNTIVVAAFEGWNDAGDAASDALEHLDA